MQYLVHFRHIIRDEDKAPHQEDHQIKRLPSAKRGHTPCDTFSLQIPHQFQILIFLRCNHSIFLISFYHHTTEKGKKSQGATANLRDLSNQTQTYKNNKRIILRSRVPSSDFNTFAEEKKV